MEVVVFFVRFRCVFVKFRSVFVRFRADLRPGLPISGSSIFFGRQIFQTKMRAIVTKFNLSFELAQSERKENRSISKTSDMNFQELLDIQN